ncbi:EamA family transporter [Pseudonocardia saturnea]
MLVLLADRRGRSGSGRTAVACGLAVLGLGLLVGWSGEGQVMAGAGSALLAAAGFAGMTLLGAGPTPTVVVGPADALGGALLLAVAAVTGGIGFTPTAAAVGLLGAFALLPTALVYALYFRGLVTAPPAVAAVIVLLEPLTGAVLAAVVLGERLGAVQLAGAVLVGGAVVLAARARRL